MNSERDGQAATSSNFRASSYTAEDLLKNETVGLVQLSDFRKRRAEVLDKRNREVEAASLTGTATPISSLDGTPRAR